MMKFTSKAKIDSLLELAGIRINGSNPWDIVVHNEDFYRRVLRYGSMGLGESYMDGWWDCDALDSFADRLIRAGLKNKIREDVALLLTLVGVRLFNFQSRARATTVGRVHYDIGNNLYSLMLDKRMMYSCGYWKNANDLDAAQEAKLELICKKLSLQPGMRILDIGCGWGGFGVYAAEKYSAETVGITISKEQFLLGQERTKSLPVQIRLQDYRDVKGTFDRVVSIGMLEHVGHKNFETFMKLVKRSLADNGIALIHTITSNTSQYASDPWVREYIFPNGLIPSLSQVAKSCEGRFVIEDIHNIGPHYERTLLSWHKNFMASWPLLEEQYGSRFRRMWTYWLLMSAGHFRARALQVSQLVMTKTGQSQPSFVRYS